MLWRLVLALLALSLLGAMAADQVIGEQQAGVSQHEPFLYGQRKLVTADEILTVVRTQWTFSTPSVGVRSRRRVQRRRDAPTWEPLLS